MATTIEVLEPIERSCLHWRCTTSRKRLCVPGVAAPSPGHGSRLSQQPEQRTKERGRGQARLSSIKPTSIAAPGTASRFSSRELDSATSHARPSIRATGLTTGLPIRLLWTGMVGVILHGDQFGGAGGNGLGIGKPAAVARSRIGAHLGMHALIGIDGPPGAEAVATVESGLTFGGGGFRSGAFAGRLGMVMAGLAHSILRGSATRIADCAGLRWLSCAKQGA